MKNSFLYAIWAGLFIICAGLGFIPTPLHSLIRVALLLAFFAPPAVLLYRAHKTGDRRIPELIRTLSFLSLLLTLIVLVLNFLSVLASPLLGDFLYTILVIVSAPMIVTFAWAPSLFLWACLLMVSRKMLKK